ncbi:DEHA2E00550p [Debaryomyces hansenii CBS767]|uniref:DEHA2E00550p n=1 Tax=Debaryomyces hansenii (strain ATCC 36239 / CBS 767 / BCRC 21394 / JCM 1990 / NBRC 0083 / IGC 2968) TaxID=284592 RepID=Q6BR19_DEBHA|nr:DEHA2E00550p [Debaryomyces hansenii CBS767]CAG87534.2 DEHA2E00550p [Debaryomyces hansenii CBS767]|eukprot:XP_459351.2 DEHA2E00550p [Debaryomyces hansenii CBS767]
MSRLSFIVKNEVEPNIEIENKTKYEQVNFEVDPTADKDINDYIEKFLDISDNARNNDKQEKEMSLLEGLKTYPKAAAWSVILSTALVMEGYDTSLMGSLYGMPAFAEKFGMFEPSSQSYQIPAKYQTIMGTCGNASSIIGLWFAGILADRFGYRKTIIANLILVAIFIFIVFFAKNIGMLMAGNILLGFPWGAFQTLSVAYASEVCPMVLRIYLTTYSNICWIFGQLLSAGVMRAFVTSTSEQSYKVPFAIQWVWPVPIIIGVFFAPESPYWLVKNDKYKEAKRSIERLITENKNVDKNILSEAMLQKMQMTVKGEQQEKKLPSYLECFKGVELRRTRIAALTWLTQNLCGATLLSYSSYFYIQAGMAPEMSFTFTIIQFALGIVGTIGSWFLSKRFGRFTIYFGGLCALAVILMVIGGLGCSTDKNSMWGVGTLLIIYVMVYDLTVGPLCYCIVAEIPSVRLRAKSIIIARNLYNISGIVLSILTPYMLNPGAWDWSAKVGFFWSGFTIVCAVWCFFDLPETKGKTFADLDYLFQQNIKSRDFKNTEASVFDAESYIHKLGDDGIKQLVEQNEFANNTGKV